VTGPSGRDGYVHIEDAMSLLRMDAPEISRSPYVRLRRERFLLSFAAGNLVYIAASDVIPEVSMTSGAQQPHPWGALLVAFNLSW
jgi:zinc transporter ZupT